MGDNENSAIAANACLSSGVKSTQTKRAAGVAGMEVDEALGSTGNNHSSCARPDRIPSAKQERLSLDSSVSSSDNTLDGESEEDKRESPKRKSNDDPPSSQRVKKAFVPSSSEDEIRPVGQRKKHSISYLSSDDESDTALRNTLAALLSTKRNVSKEEDSDSSMEATPARSSRKKVTPTESKATKRLESTAAPIPIPADKETALKNIDDEKDRNLQRLIWSMGCSYTLLPYQFVGVRALTGVPKDYPGTLSKKEYTKEQWQTVLRETKMADQTGSGRNKCRGLLMADVMGLGKTVQAVVACMLRNAIAEAQGLEGKPTLLVSPNHAVMTQWADTFIKAGVQPNHILEFIPKKGDSKPQTWHRRKATYLLLNRYQIQTEVRHLFKELPKDFNSRARTDRDYKSPLYPAAQKNLLCKLKNQYRSAHGLEKNKDKDKNETPSECVTRLLTRGNCNKVFRTLVIDEAHFLKNLLAYWGLGAALLGLHAERVIPMTGTPYNNSPQDIATLMTFVDPSLHSASEDWWKRATQHGAPAAVANAVLDWNKSYMLRREKKVLGDKLKKKEIVCKNVAPIPLELTVYERFESQFLSVLDKFSTLAEDHSPSAMRRKKELFQHMVALAACMRMALIHPVMPGGGRDVTINYSPTRRHLSRSLCNPHRCVSCKYRPETNFEGKQKRSQRKARRDDLLENLGDDLLMDDDFSIDDDDIDDDKGDLVEVPPEHCMLPNMKEGGLRHYVHEECLGEVVAEGCPLCADLCNRAQMATGKLELIDSIKKAISAANACTDEKPDPCGSIKPDIMGSSMAMPKASSLVDAKPAPCGSGKPDVRSSLTTPNLDDLGMTARPVYCMDAVAGLGGFRSSAKIESIVSDLRKSLEAGDKVLMLSFFKASLDLLEGILHYELNVNYARFDGDFTGEARQVELDRFKKEKDCRVLLMTVQTGGTGLNIVEANKCVFIDRWFNPFVHEQAEDRIYRLGQNRDVTVTYHDVSFTIDISMRVLNEIKTTNASIVLADGQTTLSMASSGLSYKEMNGLLGNSVREVKMARIGNLIGRSPGMLEAPMIAPPDFCDRLLSGGATTVDKHGEFITKRPQAAFSSIGDALLHLLGFARGPDEAQAKAVASKPKARIVTSSAGILPDTCSSSNSSEDASRDERSTSTDYSSALHCSEDTSGDELLKAPPVFKSPARPISSSASITANSFPSTSPGKRNASPNDGSALDSSDDTSGDELLEKPAVFKSPAKPISASAFIVASKFSSMSPAKSNAFPKKTVSLGSNPLQSRACILDFSSDDDSLSSIPGPVFKK